MISIARKTKSSASCQNFSKWRFCTFPIGALSIILLLLPIRAVAQQTSAPPPAAQSGASTQNPQNQQGQGQSTTPQKKDDRMFYVMPNYLTVENQAKVPPLTWKQKFSTTAKGTFDPYEFFIVGVLAGIRQADDAHPAFGQGAAGFDKRYGAAFADQVDGNIMVGGVFPSILRTDPRYFQLSHGRFLRRFAYAISRIAVSRTDSGKNVFNVSEFAGNAVASGISTLYYPSQDRSISSTVSNWGTQLSVDAFGNELKEFWPDIHRKLHKKKKKPAAAPA
ncbi:MAG: hypothetical protein WBD87_08480 [Candidatus Acidiferrales bacterium]